MLTRGRLRPKPTEIESIEEIAREDLPLLAELREEVKPSTKGIIQRLRDPHHLLARLIASGVKQGEAAQRAGYSITRVSILMNSPAFQELLAYYRGLVTETFLEEVDEFVELATANMLKAERMLADKLEQAEEDETPLSTRDLIAISRDAADRLGYGKKTTNVNVNVDFAARLERAIQRSGVTIQAQPIAGKRPALVNLGGSSPTTEDQGAAPETRGLRRV